MTKPGRNDPCPCGSGKKYKQCCWLQATPKKKKLTAKVIPGTIKVPSPFGKIQAPPSQELDDEIPQDKFAGDEKTVEPKE